MRRVGRVDRIAQGLAILRAADDRDDYGDEIGTMVLDESLTKVGRVVDVFGPVDRPYFAVTLNADVHPPSLVSSTLYAR